MKFKRGKLTIGLEFPFFALSAFFLSGEMRINFLYAVVFSLLHEAGHLICIMLSGGRVREISTNITGIRIGKYDTGMSYGAECITALAGPFVNLLFVVIFTLTGKGNSEFKLMSDINCGLFLINMLPVRTLDGGRFLNNLLLSKFEYEYVRRILTVSEILTAVLLVAILAITLILDTVNTSFVFFVLMLEFMVISQLLKS